MHRFPAAAVLAAFISSVAAQNCISLENSTACRAFSGASIAVDNEYLLGNYSFLQNVSNLTDFDTQLAQFVTQNYVTEHYVNLYGCNIGNASDYYARYTTTYLCNGMVQITYNERLCNLTPEEAPPMCADSCSAFTDSESQIVGSDDYCPTRRDNWKAILRTDSNLCGQPQDSLVSQSCVLASVNEPYDCGFGDNQEGLCNLCRAGGPNSTDSCCVFSNAEARCPNLTLPVTPATSSLTSSSSTTGSSTSGTTAPGPTSSSPGGGGLSGGDIAGIVIGSVVGFLLLLGLIIFACILYRRRRDRGSSVASLNQPSPPRQIGSGGSMIQKPTSAPNPNFTILPGNGRVTRLSAMQSEEESNGGGYAGNAPYGQTAGGQTQIPTALGAIRLSPRSNGSSGGSKDFSSPDGVGSGQSEQLPYFRDYYSNDDIHPNDRVSVLWAYQPRAGDEFELERGDMLKVVGIWDDGWATGIRISDRAEDYDGKGRSNRDSGVSNGSGRQSESPPVGEIKAFPLVCVCLPEVWRKTVEGDTSTDSGSVPI